MTVEHRERVKQEDLLRQAAAENLGLTSTTRLPASLRNQLDTEVNRLRSEMLGFDEGTTLSQQALTNLGLPAIAAESGRGPGRREYLNEIARLEQEARQGIPGFLSQRQEDAARQQGLSEAEKRAEELAQLEAELAGMQPLTSTGPEFQAPQVPGLPGKEIFQNPLLQAIQGDVTRRLFANQAARGKLGSGGTALALQDALAPQALNLGLTLQGREMGQQQQTIDNLFRLFGLGANTSIGQGSQGIGATQGIGSTVQSGGAAQAGGILGQSQAITGGLGDLAQIGGFFTGGGSFTSPTSSLGGGLFGTQFQPTVANIA
jgi:hypothetical protein